jgi:hypothetical protein
MSGVVLRLDVTQRTRARPAMRIGIGAAAAFLVLTACTPASHVGGGPVAAEQQATLIVGLAISEYQKGIFGDTIVNAILTLEWQEYDRASETLNPKGRSFRVIRSCRKLIEGCDPRAMGYEALAIPAGDYVLKSLADYDRTTSFVPLARGILGTARVPYAGSIKGSEAPRYHFAPGEVAYLGDFTFDIRKFPYEFAGLKRDDIAMQAALEVKHPEDKAGVVFRLPVGVEAASQASEINLQFHGVTRADAVPEAQ